MPKRSGPTAVSAVCIDPAIRGQGQAARLVLAVAPGVRARDERSLLHASARNTNARRLYESLGFRLRHRTAFLAARVPETARQQ
jgi:predicted GNAT family acetyltransferase